MNRPELREGDVLTRRYLLKERIATGGMSVIWRAFDQSLQRMVAIKVMDGSLDEDHPGRELIRREARATARLIHPDAIEVYDYGETVTNRGRLAAYVVMRLLEGRPLAERIAEGPLPWPEAVAITAGLAQVLAAAHDKGIVHRDVTPENVLLAADGPKLLDFGIAAFIGEADDQLVADFGTPPYVAPERLRGTTADPAVDVYALGVLLFEMLTGALPYPERTWEAIEAARREGPPPAPKGVPDLPPEVAELCRSCLSADPAERPCAAALAAALATPPPARHRTGGSRVTGWGAGAAIGALTIASVLWLNQAGAEGTDDPAALAAALPSVTAQTTLSDEGAPLSTSSPSTPQVKPVTNPRATTGAPKPARTPTHSRSEPRAEATPRRPVPHATRTPSASLTPHTSRTPQTRKHEVDPLPLATQARPIAVDEAVRRFNLLLDGAEATGDVDEDVALDLKQVLRNSIADGSGVHSVRDKIAVRFREGRLTPLLRQELDLALDKVADALAQASGV
ncbi:protein kinase domain-containing protein [Sphaerimonospora sp. CA-214678]|uniref:serine/threonine-protein kinase n=1 Tax=Sphaerimonospora sp. CA-214678 TaxID=3240029 RepID=UPI003D91A659